MISRANRLKRYVVIMLIFILLLEGLPWQSCSMVKATTTYENYLISAQTRCSELETYLLDTGTQQYGLLYEMRILAEYSMYFEYFCMYQNELGLSNTEILFYKDVLGDRFLSFNTKYSKKSDKFEKFTFARKASSIDEFRIYIKKNLAKKIPEYVGKILKSIHTEVGGLTENNTKQTKKTFGTLLSNVYYLADVYTEAPLEITNISPMKANDSEKHTAFVVNYKENNKIYGMQTYLLGRLESYSNYVELGEQVGKSFDVTNTMNIDTTKEFAENFSDAVIGSTGEIQIPEVPSLSLSYLAILSASSVYTPLVSYAGCGEFKAALGSLAPNEVVGSQLLELYNSTKDFRKPLYWQSVNANGKPTGTATLITIADFFEKILDGKVGALRTVQGAFNYDSESQVWLYKNQKVDSDTTIEITNPAQEGLDDPLDENSESELGVGENVNETSFNGLNPFIRSVSAVNSSDLESEINNSNQENEVVKEGKSEEGTATALTYAYDTITDESKLSDTLLFFGAKYARGVDNMTTAIMTNNLENAVNLSSIKDKNTRYLYLNTFGDIVTDDNLVILPGVCNPIIYNYENTYYTNTVGFMNAYPDVLKNTNYFQLCAEQDIGKYIIFGERSETSSEMVRYVATKLTAIDTVKSTAPLTVPNFNTVFSTDGLDKANTLKTTRLIFGSISNWSESNIMYKYLPAVSNNAVTVNGLAAFPYLVAEDSDYLIAKAIAQSTFRYLTLDEETSATTNINRLADNYLLHNFVINGLGGTSNPQGFAKNQLLQYEQYTNNTYTRFRQKVSDLSNDILHTLSGVDGVIGLKSSYQDEILGTVFEYVRTYWVVFFLIFLIIMLYAFAKIKRDLFQSGALLIASCGVAYLFVMVIPVYLPMFFNIVTNNLTENLSYEILATQTEYNSTSTELSVALDSDGRYKLNTTSLTLYKASARDLTDFRNSINVTGLDLAGGKTVIINQESGLFAEGDSIKINADLLFSTLEITGERIEYDGNMIYQLHSKKTVSNNVDYYTPYYQLIDSFIGKLNTLSKVYEIPRRVSTYANKTSKDNFLVYSYVNSRPFLTPGNYAAMNVEDTLGWSETELKKYHKEGAELEEILMSAFGKNVDFLGIASFLYNPSDEMKLTLWAQILQRNGYYNLDWEPVGEKMSTLVEYVNYQTRKFIFSMESQIGKLSDDVMIKMIGLRSLIALTQKASDYSSWMYPFSINYEEFSLGDVLTCVFTNDYTKFVSMDMDVVNYVLTNYGWLSLIIFDLDVVLMFIITHVIRLLVSIMYLLLGAMLLFKLVSLGDVKLPLKGYAKCSLLVMFCFTIQSLGIELARCANGSPIALYIVLLVMLFIISILLMVMDSIIRNVTDLGNSAINAKINAKLEKFNVTNKLHVSTTNLTKTHPANDYKQYNYLETYQYDRYDDVAYDDNSATSANQRFRYSHRPPYVESEDLRVEQEITNSFEDLRDTHID